MKAKPTTFAETIQVQGIFFCLMNAEDSSDLPKR